MPSDLSSSKIAAVILAAGASTRLGKPKQLLQWQGQTLLRSIAETAIAADCSPIVVVLGAYNEQIRAEVSDLPVQVVENSRWQMGIGSSIAAGVQALLHHSNTVSAAILLLCDQPLVSWQTIQQLKSIYYFTNKPIVASSYQNTIGVPALFQAQLFPELVKLQPFAGAKSVIQRYLDVVEILDFPSGEVDIDTPQDYQWALSNFLMPTEQGDLLVVNGGNQDVQQ
jgi:molybdenum cofactor cytidylyltransferase